MPRAATTSDVFNAIAEPRRRQILEVLGRGGPCAVNTLVEAVQLPQPAVSKHLGVLREVGIVTMAKRGRKRMYQLQARELKQVHDWVSTFEQFWTHQLDRIKEAAESKARDRAAAPHHPQTPKE